MSMDVVVVMDGPETVEPATDTSFGLVVAAVERGHQCWHCGPADLSFADGTVWASVSRIHPDAGAADPLGLGDRVELDLGGVEVILVRPDPPFDQRYLHLTLMLDVILDRTLVVNSPSGLRAANEKLYALRFPEVTPPTIVTADRRIVAAVAPALREDGLAFVGIDVVDGHLTEVNVTSPTGLRQLCELSGRRRDLDVVRWLEDHAAVSDRTVSQEFVDG